MTAAVELSGIRKSFDGFLALDGAEFSSRRGEVHALLGENGAGKSSLMNVLSGLYMPDEGRIVVDGLAVELGGPADASARGIGMVHQNFKLVRPFTVVENVMLANPAAGYARGLAETEAAIRRHAGELGFEIEPRRPVATLSIAEQQRVEILKVLVGGADILILDEPTAVLTDQEAERLLRTVRGLAARGAAVVLVTHKLAEVKAFADRVTIMRAGRTVATLDPGSVTNAELTTLVVGTSLLSEGRGASKPGDAGLRVNGLAAARSDGHVMAQDVSFEVGGGQIYGIAGVGGNGQTELAEAIMGVRRPLAGRIEVTGAGDVTLASPGRRRQLGIACIPADRYTFGLAGDLSVVENYAIGGAIADQFGSWLRVDTRAMRADAERAVQAFDVQGVRGRRQRAALLSGGNAQKLVIAREFSGDAKVILAHSPSRGLDVRACLAVHRRLREARDGGAAVLLISEDLDEVLALSDRIGVMTRGRIVAEFVAPADRQEVGQAMVGHA